jgi:hypothetical protein
MKRRAPGTLLFLFATSLLLVGCDKATYSVKGSGKATITYRDGEMITVKDATLPWFKEVRGVSKPEVTAKGTGQLECSIKREGKGELGEFNTDQCKASVR